MIAPEVATSALRGFEGEVSVLPPEYFYPYNPYDPSRLTKDFMYQDVTDTTYAVHHWGKSWRQGIFERALKKLYRMVRR